MLAFVYSLAEMVVGTLAVLVAVGLTLALFALLFAGIRAIFGPIWFYFVHAWEERGRG